MGHYVIYDIYTPYAYGDIYQLNHQLVSFGRKWKVGPKIWWEVGSWLKKYVGGGWLA